MQTLTAFLLATICSGCLPELLDPDPIDVEPDMRPPTASDLAPSVDMTSVDMSGGEERPDMTTVLRFFPNIQGDLDAFRCSGCHGGSRAPVLKAMPQTPVDQQANYDSFSAYAQNGANSPVLLKLLRGSGVSHVGGSFFDSTNDPVYQRWFGWINSGRLQ